MFMSLTTPTPPATFNAPVVVVVDCEVFAMFAIPAICTLPTIPAPPRTCSAPDVLLVLCVVPHTTTLLLGVLAIPTFRFLTMPTPPATTRAPACALVPACTLSMLSFDVTFALPAIMLLVIVVFSTVRLLCTNILLVGSTLPRLA